MVTLEAARVVCELPDNSKYLNSTVAVLQLFISSTKPIIRFAAIRTLLRLSLKNPQVVSPCNSDIQSLITDTNRTTATFAITTLLKVIIH